MYPLSRSMLRAAMLLFAYCGVLTAFLMLNDVPPDQRGPALLLAAAAIAVAVRKQVRRVVLTSGGTARWATYRDMQRAGMLSGGGLILGRVESRESTPLGDALRALYSRYLSAKDGCRQFFEQQSLRKRKKGQLVRLSRAVHVSVFAPTGAGKGVSCIVPFLLSCEDSCIVVDVKDGELARLTAAARRQMGHRVVLLDPGRVVTQTPDTLNPLDSIHKNDPRAMNEAAALANAVIVRTGEEREMHWLDKAEAFLAALTATTVWFGQKANGSRSLLSVAEIAGDPEALQAALDLMKASPEVWQGSLTRKGGQLSHSKGLEFSSTMSTTGRFLDFMNSPAVAESLRTSSFDLSRLRTSPMTIYLIQRAADTRTGSALLRLWLNACIREVMKGGLNPRRKVHALIDEAGSVGKMDSITDVLNVGRGFGLHLQLYYQDIGQLKKCWENPQGVLSNTTKIFFGCGDIETAGVISKSLGNETIVVQGGGTNSGWSRNEGSSSGQGYSVSSGSSYSGGSSSTWQQQSRELAKPDEILCLDKQMAITLVPGMRPLCTRLLRYYEETALFQRPGRFVRQAAAVWTFLIATALLLLALFLAAVLTPAARRVLEPPPFQPPPAANPPLIFPR